MKCACGAELTVSHADLATDAENTRVHTATVKHAEPLCEKWKTGQHDLLALVKGS